MHILSRKKTSIIYFLYFFLHFFSFLFFSLFILPLFYSFYVTLFFLPFVYLSVLFNDAVNWKILIASVIDGWMNE